MNSIFQGKKLKLTIYGGSHEPEIGFLLEGFPVVKINFENIKKDILRRKPTKIGTTQRVEEDIPIYETGFLSEHSTGQLIEVKFLNKNIKPGDYTSFYEHPRPGHIDFIARNKYEGITPLTGSGIFSGRMTLPLVVAGSLCKEAMPYTFESRLIQVGTLKDIKKLDEYLLEVAKNNDSAGGIVEVVVKGLPIGIGGPLFDKLSAKIAQTVLAIPATKGIEFGQGFNSTNLLGSQYNDLIINKEGKTKTNNTGGLNGGVTNGNDLIVRVAFRPPSSISKPQQTYSFETNQIEELVVKGRHDVSFVRRAAVIVESMIALAILDEIL